MQAQTPFPQESSCKVMTLDPILSQLGGKQGPDILLSRVNAHSVQCHPWQRPPKDSTMKSQNTQGTLLKTWGMLRARTWASPLTFSPTDNRSLGWAAGPSLLTLSSCLQPQLAASPDQQQQTTNSPKTLPSNIGAGEGWERHG